MSVAFSLFLLFLVGGMPIVFVLGISGALALILTTDIPVAILAQRLYAGLDSFTLMAIPFFVFAGILMEAGGISRRIVEFAAALVGWITGSLLMVSIVAATGLAAISGSGSADTAAISSVMQPEIKRRRYDVDFAAACIASAGSLAQIIPPSLMMVVVAIISNLSVGAMFLSGILPGLLTGGAILCVAYVHARKGGPQYREVEPFTLPRLARTLWAALPALGMPVIIVGGILGGVFTPTEAAAIAVLYGGLVGLYAYRDLKWGDFPALILRAGTLSATVMIIVGTASIFGWLINNAQVPQLLADWIQGFTQSPVVFLLIINLLLLFVGMFMESTAAILVLVPVLMPIAVAFGINPVHFGLVVVMNLSIGMVTPPYGITLYVAATVARRPVIAVARRVLWPVMAMIAVLLLTTYWPDLALALPRLAGLI